jgi:peroxiredoxin
MKLGEKLSALRDRGRTRMAPADVRILEEAVERLRMLQLAEEAVASGDVFPDFVLLDEQGRAVDGSSLIGPRPLVLVFFRGGWCPYCDVTLRALEEARVGIEAAGAELVAISPEPPDHLGPITAAKGLRFRLFSDPGLRLTRACGLHFEFTDAHAALYERLGLDVPSNHVVRDWSLPIPATYIVDRAGTVVWSFVDPDWTRRAEPDDFLKALAEACPVQDMAPSEA